MDRFLEFEYLKGEDVDSNKRNMSGQFDNLKEIFHHKNPILFVENLMEASRVLIRTNMHEKELMYHN